MQLEVLEFLLGVDATGSVDLEITVRHLPFGLAAFARPLGQVLAIEEDDGSLGRSKGKTSISAEFSDSNKAFVFSITR